jgi:hypothetical protein
MGPLGGFSSVRRALLAVSLMAHWQAAGTGLAAGDGPVAVPQEGVFAGRKGKAAKDISGIACRPRAGAGGIPCLVVNDESAFAQLATLRDGRLVAGPIVPLVGTERETRRRAAGDVSAIGSCPEGSGNFGEFDGEGIAWSPGPSGGGSYFVTGSHACGRQKAELKPSTHLLARIDVDSSGNHSPPSLTWRLGPALAAAGRVGDNYNKALNKDDQGLDIEGIAAVGDRLYFGLRAPSLPGCGPTGESPCAFVVSAGAAELFDTAPAPDRPVPTHVARLALGEHVGIRDMAALPDGRLLLLTGPSQGQDVRSGIAVTTPSGEREWSVQWLLRGLRPLKGDGEAKAEGLAVLGVSGDTARVLVLFEDPANGGAQEHTLRLP